MPARVLCEGRKRQFCSGSLLCRPGMCESLVSMQHPRVISLASFSPITGRRVVTTCADNRLRVWDDVAHVSDTPDRELVHSHDFNRYLTPFKAVWDPKDPTERTVVIGRRACNLACCSAGAWRRMRMCLC